MACINTWKATNRIWNSRNTWIDCLHITYVIYCMHDYNISCCLKLLSLHISDYYIYFSVGPATRGYKDYIIKVESIKGSYIAKGNTSQQQS